MTYTLEVYQGNDLYKVIDVNIYLDELIEDNKETIEKENCRISQIIELYNIKPVG